MQMNRMTIGFAVALTASWIAAGQASELRVGFTQDAITLDPGNPVKRETETIIRNMYDGLLTRDAKMNVVPELAESWKQTDPVTYEFHLRPNVKFHDGAPFTAEDVKFSIERILNGKIGGQISPRKDLLGPMIRVDAVDPLTVRFVLKDPWPLLPAMMPFQEMVNRAYVEKVGDDGIATKEDGTGPFRLVEWRHGDSIIMERVPDYYGGSPDIPPVGPAHVDRVIFKVMPDNASRVAALLAGDVDIINELPVSAMRQVDNNAGTMVMKANGTRTFFVAINNAKFADPRVRQALNYAVDRKLIVSRLLNNTAVPLNGVLSPEAFGFNPNLPEYAYDPAKAKAMLAEAGASNLQVTIDTEGALKDTAETIAAMLSKAGVQAKVQVWEASVLIPIWRNATQRKDRDLYLTSWGNGSLDPSDIMMPAIRSGGRGNTAGYANPEVDKLLDSAETEMDRNNREKNYFRVQELVHNDAPWIFLWLPQDIYGVSRRVHNWQPQADSRINLHRATVD
jgi:peptide/nickel transport system substrate-binding protein